MLSKEELEKITKELGKVLKDNKKFNDLLAEICAAVKVLTDEKSGTYGYLFLTKERLFFLSLQEPELKFKEILYRDIVSVDVERGYKFQEIIIKLKNEFINFKALNDDESLVDFTEEIKKVTEANKEKVVFFDYTFNYNFLLTEAKKILMGLEDYINKNKRNFCDMLTSDLINLAFLVIRFKKILNDKEIFFMALILLLIHQDISIKDKEKLCDIINDYKGLSDVEKVNKMWPKVARFFPEEIDEKSLSLLSLDLLQEFDIENGTTHYDKVRTIFITFVQCLIKADGRITEIEIEIEKKINNLIFKKRLSPVPEKKSEEKVLSKEDVVVAAEKDKETLASLLKQINELVGLENIKQEINTLVNLIKIRKARLEKGLPATKMSLHAVFYGPPGTGKTTVARLLGKVYKNLGLLQKGHIIETDRAGLVAGFVGQTAIQVNKIIEQAMDGILFIDEAYSLKPEFGGNDFGQEAIDTILKRMEDHRERLVVIVAGYPDEMKQFIDSNPGLKSRFSRYFYFKDYKPQELIQIFAIFCKGAALKPTKSARTKLLELLKSLYTKKDRTFGNGRLARNIFEQVIENQANRLVKISPLTEEILSTIQKSDIPDEDELDK